MEATGKQYSSVEEMLEDGIFSKKSLRSFKKRKKARRLPNQLAVLRCLQNLTVFDLAQKINKKEKWVEKIEMARGDDLTLKQISTYIKGLGTALTIELEKNGKYSILELSKFRNGSKIVLWSGQKSGETEVLPSLNREKAKHDTKNEVEQSS